MVRCGYVLYMSVTLGENMVVAETRPDEPVVLSIREAANKLRVSEWFVRDLARNGKLRSIKVGRRRLIPVVAITEFIAAQI